MTLTYREDDSEFRPLERSEVLKAMGFTGDDFFIIDGSPADFDRFTGFGGSDAGLLQPITPEQANAWIETVGGDE